MDNVGQLFRDSIKKVSEAAMDAMVQSLIANQEHHLQHLQDMQKWGIVKIIQKFTSSRFLHKSPCVVSAPDCSLVDLLGPVVDPGRRPPFKPPPVGNLGFTVHYGKVLLLGNPVSQNDVLMKQFEWKVIVRYGKATAETDPIRMSRETQRSPWYWLSEASRQAQKDVPLHEVHWDTTLLLRDVRDLWGDICVDVVWRRRDAPPAGGTSSSDPKQSLPPNQPDEGGANVFSGAGPATCLGSPKQQAVLGHESSTESGGPMTALPDVSPSRRRPPGPEWQLYGRAIVPLSTIIYSYGVVEPPASSRTLSTLSSYFGTLTGVPTLPSSGYSSFWLHLFPHTSDELKFYKPVAGYPGLGMTNPQTTLGFLKVVARVALSVPPLIAPIVGSTHPPHTYWTNAYSFEPQYLETYGLRTRQILTVFPRWVPKFLHLKTSMGAATRNAADWFCIIVFWYFLILGHLFASLWHVPLCAAVCATAISLSYRYGNHWFAPTRTSILFRRRRAPPPARVPQSPRSPKTAAHVAEFPRIPTSSSDDGVTIFQESDPLHEDEQSEATAGWEEWSQFAGRGGTRRLEVIPDGDAKSTKSRSPKDREPQSPTIRLGSNIRRQRETYRPPFTSVVDSPFGPLGLMVYDPSSYCPRYPVFSDDAGEQDVQEMLEHGLAVLDCVQRLAAVFSYVVEKLKFALNWEDPLLTSASLFILGVSTVALSLGLFILSQLPGPIARLPLLLPWLLFIAITDPWYQEHFWLPVFGLDFPLMYATLISRVPHLRRPTKSSESSKPAAADTHTGVDRALSADDETQTRRWVTPTAQSSGWQNLVQRLFPPRGTKEEEGTAAPIIKASRSIPSDLAASATTPHATASGFRLSDVPMSQDQPRHRPLVQQQQPSSPHVTVLGVLARVRGSSLAEEESLAGSRKTTLFGSYICGPVYTHVRTILGSVGQAVLRRVIRVLAFVAAGVLRYVDIWYRLLWNWWIRLPDRREIEHRQIAAAQYVESLGTLLPYGAEGASSPSLSPMVERYTEREVDLYLKNRFRQASGYGKNPIAGFMGGLRLAAASADDKKKAASATRQAASLPAVEDGFGTHGGATVPAAATAESLEDDLDFFRNLAARGTASSDDEDDHAAQTTTDEDCERDDDIGTEVVPTPPPPLVSSSDGLLSRSSVLGLDGLKWYGEASTRVSQGGTKATLGLWRRNPNEQGGGSETKQYLLDLWRQLKR